MFFPRIQHSNKMLILTVLYFFFIIFTKFPIFENLYTIIILDWMEEDSLYFWSTVAEANYLTG